LHKQQEFFIWKEISKTKPPLEMARVVSVPALIDSHQLTTRQKDIGLALTVKKEHMLVDHLHKHRSL